MTDNVVVPFCPTYTTQLKILNFTNSKFQQEPNSFKKSLIRETKHLSTNADSTTDAIGGWNKNTPKPDFLTNGKNHQKHKNSETSRDMPQLVIRPSTGGL